MDATTTEATAPRTINPAAMERRVEAIGDWKVDGPTMSCAFSFADDQEALRFVTRIVRRARVAGRPIDLRLDDRTITLSFAQKDGGFTPEDIKLARQLSNTKKDEADTDEA